MALLRKLGFAINWKKVMPTDHLLGSRARLSGFVQASPR
jgi:hypothetical protein